MKAAYMHKGESLDYKNTTKEKIAAGDVLVMGNRIGVAGTDIEQGELGSAHVSGVFELDKADTAEIAIGTVVYLAENGITATEENNTPAGYAAAESPAGSGKVWVKINA